MNRKRRSQIWRLAPLLLFLSLFLFAPRRVYAGAIGQTTITVSAAGVNRIKVKAASSVGGDGYQYQISKDPAFSSVLENRKSQKSTCTFKNLRSDKVYYLRARAYAKKGVKSSYGPWSKTARFTGFVSAESNTGDQIKYPTGIGWKDAYIQVLKLQDKKYGGKGMLVDLGIEVPALEFNQFLIWYAPGNYDKETESKDVRSLYSALADAPVFYIKGKNNIRQNVYTYFGKYHGEPLFGTVTSIYRIQDGELKTISTGSVKYYDDGKNNSYEWNGKKVSRKWFEAYLKKREAKETFVSGSEEKYSAEEIIEQILND